VNSRNKKSTGKPQYNDKQLSFLTLISQGMSEDEAAAKCWGKEYARKKKYRDHPNFVEAIKMAKSSLAEAMQLTREDVLGGFEDAANLARTNEDPMGMISAYREIAKMLGYYEPEVKRVEHQLIENKEFERLSDARLLELIDDDTPITLDKSQYEVVDVEVEAFEEAT
jgi:hypothetical protein